MALYQLIDGLVSEAFDVHRAFGGEMDDALLEFRWAQQSHTAWHHLSFETHHRGPADGAMRRPLKWFLLTGPSRFQNLYDLGNDIPRPLDHDPVSSANILTGNLIGVM